MTERWSTDGPGPVRRGPVHRPVVPVALVLAPPCESCGDVHDGALATKDRRLHVSISVALGNRADPAHIVVAASEMAAELNRMIGRAGA